jgi:hypothetical protein
MRMIGIIIDENMKKIFIKFLDCLSHPLLNFQKNFDEMLNSVLLKGEAHKKRNKRSHLVGQTKFNASSKD